MFPELLGSQNAYSSQEESSDLNASAEFFNLGLIRNTTVVNNLKNSVVVVYFLAQDVLILLVY